MHTDKEKDYPSITKTTLKYFPSQYDFNTPP